MYNITKEDIKNSSLEQKRMWAREGLASSKNFIYLAAGIYIISMLFGFVYPEKFHLFLKYFKKSIDRFQDKSTLVIILLIFFRNFMTSLTSAFLGVLLGLVPALSAISNGILLGTIISVTTSSNQLVKLWLLIPHGIFELPALIIAWGLGMWHGAWYFRQDKNETIKDRRLKVSTAFFRYSVPLLIIAAIIEGLIMKY